MNNEEILQILSSLVAEGHYVLNSGVHANRYVNKDAAYPHTRLVSKLCLELARRTISQGGVVEVVIGPAMGGIILSQWTAHHLTELTGQEVLSVYAEKASGGNGFVIKRGYGKLVKGKNVLVVEDIFTSGGSAKGVVETARRAGGTVVGVIGLANRGEATTEDVGGPPFFVALGNMSGFKTDTWPPAVCPLCAQGIPIDTELGKGPPSPAAETAK